MPEEAQDAKSEAPVQTTPHRHFLRWTSHTVPFHRYVHRKSQNACCSATDQDWFHLHPDLQSCTKGHHRSATSLPACLSILQLTSNLFQAAVGTMGEESLANSSERRTADEIQKEESQERMAKGRQDSSETGERQIVVGRNGRKL